MSDPSKPGDAKAPPPRGPAQGGRGVPPSPADLDARERVFTTGRPGAGPPLPGGPGGEDGPPDRRPSSSDPKP